MSFPVAALAPIATLVAEVAEGRVPSVADAIRTLMGVGLELAQGNVEDLRGYLDDAARARAEAVFETLKNAKVGPDGE